LIHEVSNIGKGALDGKYCNQVDGRRSMGSEG
jgi:hypothetical protein